MYVHTYIFDIIENQKDKINIKVSIKMWIDVYLLNHRAF